MLISWKHNFLFIHVAKTGGTALTQALTPYARIQDRFAYGGGSVPILRRGLTHCFGGEEYIENITGLNAHSTLREVEEKFGADAIAPLVKAAFVRNPFTRTYSLYAHIKRTTQHQHHGAIRDLEFEDAVLLMSEKYWTMQAFYLSRDDSNKPAVEFVGYFERLDQDSEALAAALRLPKPLKLARMNVDPGPSPNLRQLYGGALDKFVEIHRQEFELLGYSTDIDHAHEPPAR